MILLLLIKQIVSLIIIILIITYSSQITATDNKLPDLGNEAQTIISPKEEKLLGKAWLYQMQHAGLISSNLIVNHYLQNLGEYLVNNYNQRNSSYQQYLPKFHFFLIENSEINAFAFMGGNIGVFSGLINLTDTESELGSILSHEIGHVLQQHFSRQLLEHKRLMPITILEAITMAAIGIPDLIVPILGGHMQQMLNFSRAQEQEADHIAVNILHNSKYDPLALGDILTKMNRISNDDQMSSKYFSTHPLFKERIFEAYSRGSKSTYQQYVNSIDYQLIKIIVHNKLVKHKSDLLMKIHKQLKNHPYYEYNNELLLHFEKAITLQNLYQYSKAKDILVKLAMHYPNNVIIQVYLAELLLSHEPKLSKQKLENLIKVFPENLPLMLTYAKALMILNEPLKAKNCLSAFNKEHLEDLLPEPQIYELLIACNQQLQDQIEIALLQAKLMVVNYQLEAAEIKIDSALSNLETIKKNKLKTNKTQHIINMNYQSNFNKINKFKIELQRYRKFLKSIKL